MACVSKPMTGGDGENSYIRNCSFQTEGVETAKTLIQGTIHDKLDLKQIIASSSAFCIADLGCSVGPNTFLVVQNIIDSILLKYKSTFPYQADDEELQFQVLLNDMPCNDFNTLFQSLPPERKYLVSGVPGRFQGRLFPKASVHFVHSSYALHWLSSLPKELVVMNKGSILYHNAPKKVMKAYSTQFGKDMTSFLAARAEEVVPGGLMTFLLLCLPNDVLPSECINFLLFDFMRASLLDMAKTGSSITVEQVESFNVPIYYTTPRELALLVEKNGCFSIERTKAMAHPFVDFDEVSIKKIVLLWRGIFAGLVGEVFGEDVVGQFFDRYAVKCEEYALGLQPFAKEKHLIDLFVVLKRNKLESCFH